MLLTSMFPASQAVGDPKLPADSIDSVGRMTVDAGGCDVPEEDAVAHPLGREVKYPYAVASGKAKILRISSPTLGCRK